MHPTIKLRQVKGTVLSTAGRAISSLPQNMPAHRLTTPLQSQQQVARSPVSFPKTPSYDVHGLSSHGSAATIEHALKEVESASPEG